MIKTEFEYELKTPLNINNEDVRVLTFHAPTSENRGPVSAIKSLFMSSMRSMMKDNKSDDDEKETAQKSDSEINADAIAIMLSSSGDKTLLGQCMDLFEGLIVSKGVCALENGTPLSRMYIKQISYDDFESMMGEYIKNFLLPSQMRAN
jgi:hypothetical protein